MRPLHFRGFRSGKHSWACNCLVAALDIDVECKIRFVDGRAHALLLTTNTGMVCQTRPASVPLELNDCGEFLTITNTGSTREDVY